MINLTPSVSLNQDLPRADHSTRGAESPSHTATETSAAVPKAAKAEGHARDGSAKDNPDQKRESLEAIRATLDELSIGIAGFGTRLLIEANSDAGAFVYKSVSRDTGEVSFQWPFDGELKLRSYLRSLDQPVVDEKA